MKKSSAKSVKSVAKSAPVKPPVAVTDKRKKAVNAERPLTITITDKHIANATCGDPEKCVIGQALADNLPKEFGLEGFQVGASCTKLILSDKVIRYKTPYKLAQSLKTFDKTSQWHLPPGQYTLLVYVGAKRRWESARRQGGKQDTFRGRITAPTRRALTVTQLCAKAA